MTSPHNRISAFVEVKEDWYGNFRIADDRRFEASQLVRVSLILLSTPEWRVCVWGNDDFGLERDFLADQHEAAMNLYVQIVTSQFPTQKWLRSLGMVGA